MSAIEPSPALVNDIEQAMSGLQLSDDTSLFYVCEALHELSHILGGMYHEQTEALLDRLNATDDEDEGTIREVVAEFDGSMRLQFTAWLREHDLPYLRWWVRHTNGAYLLWELHRD